MSIVIDGSNVIRVLGKENPHVEILAEVLDYFKSEQIDFTVFLDAWLISTLGRIASDQQRLLARLI